QRRVGGVCVFVWCARVSCVFGGASASEAGSVPTVWRDRAPGSRGVCGLRRRVRTSSAPGHRDICVMLSAHGVCLLHYAPIMRRGSVRLMILLMPVWLNPL